MKKILFVFPIVVLLAAGCNSSSAPQSTSNQNQPTQQTQTPIHPANTTPISTSTTPPTAPGDSNYSLPDTSTWQKYIGSDNQDAINLLYPQNWSICDGAGCGGQFEFDNSYLDPKNGYEGISWIQAEQYLEKGAQQVVFPGDTTTGKINATYVEFKNSKGYLGAYCFKRSDFSFSSQLEGYVPMYAAIVKTYNIWVGIQTDHLNNSSVFDTPDLCQQYISNIKLGTAADNTKYQDYNTFLQILNSITGS